MNNQNKKPVKPGSPKIMQPATPPHARVPPSPLSAPGVVQARMAQFKSASKIVALPSYRQAVQKVVQPKLTVQSHQPKLRGALIATARTIQRAKEENPYKKDYDSYAPMRSSSRASARASPYGGKGAKSERLQEKSGGGIKPNYKPKIDSLGNTIWDGSRSSLKWSPAITGAMAPSKVNGCQFPGCTNAADSIDHIQDFADLQSAITQYLICDGTHHWKACYKDDAVSVYNNGDDNSNMRWACTTCNSSKGGKHGVYENQPLWKGQCPGDSCNYTHKGTEM